MIPGSMEPMLLEGFAQPVEIAVARLAASEPVIVEGPRGAEVVVPASRITDEDVCFLVSEARGVLRVALTPMRAVELRLVPVTSTRSPAEGSGECWCVTVEARDGVSTGISAGDRARTIAVLADPGAAAAELVAPGHVQPVIVGLHDRRAHEGTAEAAVELCRRAGLPPVAVLCHLLDDEGDLAGPEHVARFAERHGLAHVCLDDLGPGAAIGRFSERRPICRAA
jgi:3,4-dihydroxy 2-butanone 4-phosphate synthase / GTP cyclohydrolase II